MGRPRQFVTGHSGVSQHKQGYYIIHPETGKREYFPLTPDGLARADQRFFLLEKGKLLSAALSLAEARTELETITGGASPITDEVAGRWQLADDPSTQGIVLRELGVDGQSALDVVSHRDRKINPEWLKAAPVQTLLQAMGYSSSRASAIVAKGEAAINDSRLTVAKIGKLYREWYTTGRQLSELGAARAVNRQTLRDHDRYYGEFEKWIGGQTPIEALTDEQFRDYRDHVIASVTKRKSVGNKPNWVRLRFATVKQAFNRVRRLYPTNWPRGLTGDGGALSILEIQGGTREADKKIISPAEFASMFSVADSQWQAVLLVSLNCAFKNQDASDLDWKHIDFDRGILDMPRGKTGRKRRIPLHRLTLEALRAWKEMGGTSDHVFYTARGARLKSTTNNVNKSWERLRGLAARAGHPCGVSFESLRDSAATVCFNALKSDRELGVKMLLGHASDACWKYYTDVSPDFLLTTVEKIGDKYFGGLSLVSRPVVTAHNLTGRGGFQKPDQNMRDLCAPIPTLGESIYLSVVHSDSGLR